MTGRGGLGIAASVSGALLSMRVACKRTLVSFDVCALTASKGVCSGSIESILATISADSPVLARYPQSPAAKDSRMSVENRASAVNEYRQWMSSMARIAGNERLGSVGCGSKGVDSGPRKFVRDIQQVQLRWFNVAALQLRLRKSSVAN